MRYKSSCTCGLFFFSHSVLVSHLSCVVAIERRNLREHPVSRTGFPRPSKLLKAAVGPGFPDLPMCHSCPLNDNPTCLSCPVLELSTQLWILVLFLPLLPQWRFTLLLFLRDFPCEPKASQNFWFAFSQATSQNCLEKRKIKYTKSLFS